MISFHTCPLATLGGKDTGGMNVYVHELTKHLGQIGIHVDVFTRSQDEHVPHVLHDLGYGNRVVHIPAGPEVPMSKEELTEFIPEFVEGIQCFAEKKNLRYDLIHSHYWMSGIAAQKLKETWNIPILHMFHTLGKMKNRIARSESEKEGQYRIDGENQVLKMADCIVAATPAEKTQLAFLYNANKIKTAIIPPGVDTSHFYPIPVDEAKEFIGAPVEDRMLLYVGRIEPLKGIDTLIQAIAHMQEGGAITGRDHYLVVIGGNPRGDENGVTEEMERLQNLCDELGLGDLVLFLGKRGQETLPYYYSAAEIVVVPSHYESFGMVALEAMACGTPVVASQVGGLAYLVKDGVTGYVVPNDDPVALGKQLSELVEQADLRKILGEQAAEYAIDYDWGKISTRMVDLYHAVLEGKSPCGTVSSYH